MPNINDFNLRPFQIERFHSQYEQRGDDECWPWIARATDGYGEVAYRDGGVRSYFRATHVALRLANQPKPSPSHFALHRCNNTLCVNPAHLYWGTHQDNMNDYNAVRYHIGERCPGATLSNDEVLAIRDDPRPSRAIAREYGVSKSTVLRVKNGVCWQHLVGP